ncbi:hypothetical protein OG897_36590 [Streptomyces sp. NBC_00237]|uniref:hypothetical protein n=1 Tax=Streptomyces sp. NBC_00237 TaxID=2975687 RepID=UPI002250DF5B|nr:hypothetical protein [Streptomyces sp. NBC_00237]MCX5206907.1 hypothetical protein [Streptomyces sp. NBC_00237]
MPVLDDRYRTLAHTTLNAARHTLAQHTGPEQPTLTDLLHNAVDTTARTCGGTRPSETAWLWAEAAFHLAHAAGWNPSGLTDPALPTLLTRLDQRPHAARLRLLDTAATRTAPTVIPLPEPTPTPVRVTGRRQAGGCGCACTAGGFCGGCGHAGCGRRP